MPSSLVAIARHLRDAAGELRFAPPVTHVYNPLDHAWEPHHRYLQRFGGGRKQVLLLGMNPGPWGMSQTGVPFGEVAAVRDWLGLTGAVRPPADQHPRRPIEGFACRRSEVSGRRFWGWARERCGSPEAFFRRFFVWNYCPLAFLEASGRNRTPDHLAADERRALQEICDEALRGVVEALAPEWVLGIGRFAEKRAGVALAGLPVRRATILHPSPASPLANRGWAEQVEAQLAALGIAAP